MADADPTALQALSGVLRQLREITGVREARPGVFQFRGAAFARFDDDGGVLRVELRKPGGSGFDRFDVQTAPQRRKLIDEARLRAKRLDDE